MNDILLTTHLPLIIVGFICGFVKFSKGEQELINSDKSEEERQKLRRSRVYRIVDIVLTSVIMCFASYHLIEYFLQLNFVMCVSISSLITLLGIDKCLDLLDRLRGFKTGVSK